MRCAVGFTCALLLAAALVAQTPQKPTFRGGVNFVRVDVYPTAQGKAVADLKQDEFEVLEDGAPQRIVTFEHVAIRAPGPESERAEPTSIQASNDAAADARNRLFVLFLDSYHSSPDASTAPVVSGGNSSDDRVRGSAVRLDRSGADDSHIGRALVTFLQRLIGPDDLIAVTRPELPVTDLTFTRRPSSFDELLLSGGEWQRQWNDFDAVERSYLACYPGEPSVVHMMIARRRERMVIDGLRDLVIHLRALREERKAILVVTEGWWLFKPDPTMVAVPQGAGLGRPPIGVKGGQPVIGDPRDAGPRASCDRDRMLLANYDNAIEFRNLLNEANRSNASFYPIDPRGLDSALQRKGLQSAYDSNVLGGRRRMTPGVAADARSTRLDSIETLASATDGVAIINDNNLAANLRRISDDLSSYYLLGYDSANSKFDGKFRKITVRVKRPGVTVRARSGYNAPTEAEAKAMAEANAPPPEPAVAARDAALAELDRGRPDRVLLLRGGVSWPTLAAGGSHDGVLSVVVELDAAAARAPGWVEGGQITASILDLDGRTLATRSGRLSSSARSCLLEFTDTPLPAGAYLARVKAQWSVLTTSEQLRIVVPDESVAGQSVLGQPIVYRRGPYTGAGFQPTAELRFRKAERVRVSVPLSAKPDSVSAQLLDRKGRVLPVPVTTSQQAEGGRAFLIADLVVAPLAPSDYVIEISAQRGEKTDKSLAAIRIIP